MAEQQVGIPVVEKATPDMYANPTVGLDPLKPFGEAPKKNHTIYIALISLLILALLTSIIYFLVTGKKYAGVVDPSSQKSICTPGTKLTWWLPDTVQTTPANYAEIISGYNAQRAGGPVIIETVTRKYDNYDYYTNLLNAMAKNAGPDIFMIRNDDLPGYKDYILPLSNFDAKAINQYKQSFVDLVGKETVLNDKLYGVTTYVDNLQMYYNKDLLDQNGVALPAANWDDIKRQARTLSKSKERGFSLSTISLGIGSVGDKPSNISENQDIIPTIIAQYGGTIYDTKTNSVGFQTQDGQIQNSFSDAIKFYLDFSNNTSEQYSWDEFMGNNIEEFLQNRLVYLIGYKELDKTLQERRPDLDYQVASLPQINPSKKATFGKYFVNVMSRSLGAESETQKDVGVKRACAEEFLGYMTTQAAQQSYINQTQMPSAYRSILNDQANEGTDQKTRIFADGALNAVNYYKPDVINSEKIWGNLVTEARSQKDVAAALNNAITTYNTIVGAGPVIRAK